MIAPFEISKGKWCVENKHGRAHFRIDGRGVHAQRITDVDVGHVVVNDDLIISFEDVLAKAEGQATLGI